MQLLDFFTAIGKLKEIKRTGWVRCGVKNPESVAGHSFRMATMALMLGKKLECDIDRLVKICLVHDLHESICGDLILDFSKYYPEFKGLDPKEKKQREFVAFEELKKILGKENSEEFTELWTEFENQKTKEAKIAKELDVLEMLLQASEYERQKNFEKPLWKLWIKENDSRVKHPVLREILDKIIEKMK